MIAIGYTTSKKHFKKNEREKFKEPLMAKDYSQRKEENALNKLKKIVPIDKFNHYLDLIGVCSY